MLQTTSTSGAAAAAEGTADLPDPQVNASDIANAMQDEEVKDHENV